MIRKRLDYPPFTNIAVVTFSGRRDRGVFEAAKSVKPLLCEECSKSTLVLGPSRCPIPKIANKYRWRLVVKERDIELLIERLSDMGDRFWKNNKDKDVTMGIDINPYNML